MQEESPLHPALGVSSRTEQFASIFNAAAMFLRRQGVCACSDIRSNISAPSSSTKLPSPLRRHQLYPGDADEETRKRIKSPPERSSASRTFQEPLTRFTAQSRNVRWLRMDLVGKHDLITSPRRPSRAGCGRSTCRKKKYRRDRDAASAQHRASPLGQRLLPAPSGAA